MATQIVTNRAGDPKDGFDSPDASAVPAPESAQIMHVADPNTAIDAIRHNGRRVVTFVGFSGAGYEEPVRVRNLLADILAVFDPRSVTICSGATGGRDRCRLEVH
jgi:hypothetical protein